MSLSLTFIRTRRLNALNSTSTGYSQKNTLRSISTTICKVRVGRFRGKIFIWLAAWPVPFPLFFFVSSVCIVVASCKNQSPRLVHTNYMLLSSVRFKRTLFEASVVDKRTSVPHLDCRPPWASIIDGTRDSRTMNIMTHPAPVIILITSFFSSFAVEPPLQPILNFLSNFILCRTTIFNLGFARSSIQRSLYILSKRSTMRTSSFSITLPCSLAVVFSPLKGKTRHI